MKKIFKKKFISDLPTLIFSQYETGTTGIFFLRPMLHAFAFYTATTVDRSNCKSCQMVCESQKRFAIVSSLHCISLDLGHHTYSRC
jgi:hypothetical protein